MAIKVLPWAWLSVVSSTAQTGDGARAASTEPVRIVPMRMPEPFRNSRRTSGRLSFGTSPFSSPHELASAVDLVMGIKRMSCLLFSSLWVLFAFSPLHKHGDVASVAAARCNSALHPRETPCTTRHLRVPLLFGTRRYPGRQRFDRWGAELWLRWHGERPPASAATVSNALGQRVDCLAIACVLFRDSAECGAHHLGAHGMARCTARLCCLC